MNKNELKEIAKLAIAMNKQSHDKFLLLKGYMLGSLHKKKVQ